MKIILCDIRENLIFAWKKQFRQYSDVVVTLADITRVNCEAIVSPANSFGFMDGGLDYYISERFGWDLEKRLQQKIKELPERELLIGQAMLIETGDIDVPFLISAPTVRVPSSYNIDTSLNAYLAMKAVLIKCKSDKRISSVAIPGLCTGVGGMAPEIAAKQMFEAYKEIVLGVEPDIDSFKDAQKHQQFLNPSGMIWKY